ncbi:phospholipase/carboxylesterase [Pedobacter westerhofensis]|uniref:Phospholipase/carboxylesterase n=1 Tax=Pedobacter westerhofensis TaxID=425512 RepID=A0A521FL28_9SPHI|nr:esterase [Pedobacter westerhofensis]SMO96908.1 phospholipase/carboxylesterase [Pedobacter westerhofensis]
MENKIETIKGEELMLSYKSYQPAQTDTKPGLIILLHGIGSNEDDLFRLKDNFPVGFVIVSARAPYTISPGRYTWFELAHQGGKPVINEEQAEKSRLVLNTFISQLTERYGIDDKNIYLGGFSQGGIMSYSVGLTFPQKLKGIFILSSRLLPEVKPLIKVGLVLEKLRAFIAHGIEDNVLPIHYAREATSYLRDLMPLIEYHEYEMEHRTGQEEIADLNTWIEAGVSE